MAPGVVLFAFEGLDEQLELLAQVFANALVRKQAEVRKSGKLPFLRPDAKSQVTLRYEAGKPVAIDAVALAPPDVELEILFGRSGVSHRQLFRHAPAAAGSLQRQAIRRSLRPPAARRSTAARAAQHRSPTTALRRSRPPPRSTGSDPWTSWYTTCSCAT